VISGRAQQARALAGAFGDCSPDDLERALSRTYGRVGPDDQLLN